MTTEAEATDATRAKKTVGRTTQAAAPRMVTSAGASAGGGGGRATVGAAPALKFNLKMTGVVATGGALFAKKPSASATTVPSSKPAKAPFAVAIGAKQGGGKELLVTDAYEKERDKPMGLSFKGFSMPKLSKPKPKAVDLSASVPQAKQKSAATTGANPIIAASVKKSSSLSSGVAASVAAQNRFSTRPSSANAKAPLFQLKPPTAPMKPGTATTKGASVKAKNSTVTKEAELVPTAAAGVDAKGDQPASPFPVVKKRTEPPDSTQTSGSRKKIKVGTPSKPVVEKAPTIPRALRVLNVVSPEPRRVLLHTPKKKPNASSTVVGSTSVAAQDPELVESAILPDRGMQLSPLHRDEGSSSELVTASQHSSLVFSTEAAYSFVTKEEEELLKLPSEDKMALAAEEDAFVHGIRTIQTFVDEVENNHHTTTSRLLASHATISECLFDMLTDISALAGGLQLLELDKITAKSLEDFDASPPPDIVP